jgi:hypothetical protein
MRSALILGFYLSDQLLSVISPFSSGPFTIAVIVICMRRVVVSWGELRTIFFASTVAIGAGLAGAFLSGTPVSVFFIATIVMFTGMWIVGVGLRAEDAVLITPEGALFGVLVLSGFLLISILGWDAMSSIQGTPTNRGVGLYNEPSHYALFVMPLWLIAYQHRTYRPWLYIALAFSVVWCFSTTLLVFVLCALVLQVYLTTAQKTQSLYKHGRRVIVAAMLIVLTYSISSVLTVDGMPLQDYLGSRLYGLVNSGEVEAQNLSSLVVLQGIELAQLSFSQSFGFGVGLGNFGANDQIVDQSVYRTLINTILDGGDLSLRDGGLLANKLVGELGVLALAIPLMLVFYFRRLKATLDGRQLIYHGAWAVTLICLVFIRALPYFSAPVCLSVFSLAGVLATQGRLAAGRRIKSPLPTIKESES